MMAMPLFMLLSLVSILISGGNCGLSLVTGQCVSVRGGGGTGIVLPYTPTNYNISANTPELCIASCKEEGHSFAGLALDWANGKIQGCKCGPHIAHQTVFDSDSSCPIVCNGDPEKTCGGTRTYEMSAYSTGSWIVAYSEGQLLQTWPVRLGVGEEFELNSTLITSIPMIGKEWKINYELKPTTFSKNFNNDSATSSLYVSTGEDNKTLTAIYFHPSYGMKIEYEVNGHTFLKTVRSQIIPKIDAWTNIEIYQEKLGGKYMLNIGINGINIVSVESKFPRELTNVQVFSGDPRRLAQAGFFRELHFLTKTEECCKSMTVNDKTYEFQGTADMTEHGCIYNCLYTSTEAGDSGQYCFAPGDHAVQCGAPAPGLV